MKQKLGFGLMLTALSFAFLFGLVPVLEQAGTSVPVDELFRDWSESSSTCNYICYMETPYADSRGFAEQQEALEAAGAIPVLESYENFQASTAYNQDGSIYEISLAWYTQDIGVHESMEVTIIPQEPEDKSRWDGLYTVDKEQATATKIGAVTVYGDKYEDGLYPSWVLVFTLPDGTYCQICVVGEEAYQDLGAVLEFLLDQGVDWDAFALEKGDLYETIPFAEVEEFQKYAPDISGLPLYETQALAMTRNGVPISAELQYSYEEAQNSVIFWCIETDLSDWKTEAALGNLEEQTEDAVRAALVADRTVGFYDGDIYLYVDLGNEVPVELALELFRRLNWLVALD
jgi:hypothetical protein